MNANQQPEKVAGFNVYEGGKNKLLGLATVQLPSFEALSEEIKGAGIMGSFSSPSLGQFGPMSIAMSFRLFWGSVYDYTVAMPYTFDLRAALESLDNSTHEKIITQERWSILTVISKIDPGKRESAAAADASIEGSVRIAHHWIDGKEVLSFDLLNGVYRVNSVDMYEPIRSAIE